MCYSWGVDWIGKENGPEERGSTSSASRSEAPSPQGEGLETGEADSSTSLRSGQNDNEGTGKRIATAPEAPRNDNEGNGGRSMSAPTEERGRQSAVPTGGTCNRGRFLVCDSQTRKRPLSFYAFARWRFCSGWGGLSSLGEISPALVRAILVSMGPTSS